MSLSVTSRQMKALRGQLAEVTYLIALASAVANPHLARRIIETTSSCIWTCQPCSHEAMIQHDAVRDVLVSSQTEKWTLGIRIAGLGSRLLPVCSRREALCT